MRMWCINPRLLCDKHLLGEHGEIHKHRHNFVKRHSIAGRVYPVAQIEPLSMADRHEVLAQEMANIGLISKVATCQDIIKSELESL
jgi:Pyrimidine dimer DNA glycosylase